MQIGMVGLGRMGGGMTRRLMRGGHRCVVFDRDADNAKALAAEGAAAAASLAELVAALAAPRVVWIMVPVMCGRRRRWSPTGSCSSRRTARTCRRSPFAASATSRRTS